MVVDYAPNPTHGGRTIQPQAVRVLDQLVTAAEAAGYEVLRVADLRAALDKLDRDRART